MSQRKDFDFSTAIACAGLGIAGIVGPATAYAAFYHLPQWPLFTLLVRIAAMLIGICAYAYSLFILNQLQARKRERNPGQVWTFKRLARLASPIIIWLCVLGGSAFLSSPLVFNMIVNSGTLLLAWLSWDLWSTWRRSNPVT